MATTRVAPLRRHAALPLSIALRWGGNRPKPHHTWPYPCGFDRSGGRGGEANKRRPLDKIAQIWRHWIMDPNWVTASAAIATVFLALTIAVVNLCSWYQRQQQEKRDRELTPGNWEMLHILTRASGTRGLLDFRIDADWDSDENDDELPEALRLAGFFTQNLQELVAKGVLYQAPGVSERKSSFRFTDEGRKLVHENNDKIVDFYGDYSDSP